jgi:Chemotaxis phosphatase CheX
MGIDPFLLLRPDILAQVAKTTFQGAMNIAVEGPLALPAEQEGLWISSTIFISGEWAGLLRLDMPEGLAGELTAAWLGLTTVPDRSAVRDAMGELANTLAGILKPSLPGARSVSVPRVCDTLKALTIKGKRDIIGATLSFGNRLFQASLWKCPPEFCIKVVPKPELNKVPALSR